ncbi:MAG: electron transfer flavoprotein subunit alpha/FixB family protein [Chloroflexi bacterium]|nr:electron transfer flavoprotein subunit alpha/FixB family protein [Chloroflexota bacterium]
MSVILIAGETGQQGVTQQTLELVTAARSLAGDGGEVIAVFTGAQDAVAPALPADSVYLLKHEALGEKDSGTFDAATDVLSALASELDPDIILFARTDRGSVVAPRLAMRLRSAFARDCVAAAWDAGDVIVTRPVHGGNANARFRLAGKGPCVVMFRPGAHDAGAHDAGAHDPASSTTSSPELRNFDPAPHIRESRSKLLRTGQEQKEGVRLEDAEVVVSGGRGLGGPEPFTQLAELADLLGGAVGASRAACDAGWIDHSHQVGLTGKSVSPRLYLSFGISGASQHMAGCSSSRNIVAVNTDADASIFGDARFGVVGDWEKVLPAFISAVRDIS